MVVQGDKQLANVRYYAKNTDVLKKDATQTYNQVKELVGDVIKKFQDVDASTDGKSGSGEKKKNAVAPSDAPKSPARKKID